VEAVTSNPIDGDQLIHALMCGRDPTRSLDWINDKLRQKLAHSLSINPDLFPSLPQELSWTEKTNEWRIPTEYSKLDIAQHVLSLARDSRDTERVEWELAQYRARNLMPVLCTIKYLVDLMRREKIIWGVGRGSSVSSLVLFLLGVHRIDPMEWKLDATEFFK
jgi:DNA polymerase III alpha subunit